MSFCGLRTEGRALSRRVSDFAGLLGALRTCQPGNLSGPASYTQRLPAGPGPPLPGPVTQELVLLARLCVLGSWAGMELVSHFRKVHRLSVDCYLSHSRAAERNESSISSASGRGQLRRTSVFGHLLPFGGIKGRAFFVTGSLRCVNAPLTFSFVIPIMPGFHFLWNWSCFILGGGKRAAAPLLGLLVGHVLT